MSGTRDDAGTVFPPRDEWDVLHYDNEEVVAGYRDHRPEDPTPGPNHSPAYRWGWTNRRKDYAKTPDGYEDIRKAYYRLIANAA